MHLHWGNGFSDGMANGESPFRGMRLSRGNCRAYLPESGHARASGSIFQGRQSGRSIAETLARGRPQPDGLRAENDFARARGERESSAALSVELEGSGDVEIGG